MDPDYRVWVDPEVVTADNPDAEYSLFILKQNGQLVVDVSYDEGLAGWQAQDASGFGSFGRDDIPPIIPKVFLPVARVIDNNERRSLPRFKAELLAIETLLMGRPSDA